MVTSPPTTSAPGTDKTGMGFRRILTEISCQSCLSPGSEPTPRGGFSTLLGWAFGPRKLMKNCHGDFIATHERPRDSQDWHGFPAHFAGNSLPVLSVPGFGAHSPRWFFAPVQAGLAPLVNRDIEVGSPEMGGDGSGNEIIVSRVKENRGWTQFAARRLLEVDPDEDDLTGSKGHGSTVRRLRRRQRMPPQTAAVRPRARRRRLRKCPTGVQPESVPRAEAAMRFQAERQSNRSA